MAARDLAQSAITLLRQEGRELQALALIRAQDEGFRAQVIAELLRADYRAAPLALLVCADDAATAHVHGIRLARWALEERLRVDAHIPEAPRTTAEHTLRLLTGPDDTLSAGPEALRAASVELARSARGKVAARAFRLAAKVEEAKPGDFRAWAPKLRRLLDVAVFDELGASRGRALGELERLCMDVLDPA
ncbi:MAG: hypothetical protein AAF447_23995 [Myxococcota bacterium]